MGFLMWIANRTDFSKSDKVNVSGILRWRLYVPNHTNDSIINAFFINPLFFRNLDSPRNEYSFQHIPGTSETLIVRIIKCWEGLIKFWNFIFWIFSNLLCNFRAHKLWFTVWSRVTWFRILSSGRFVFWITKKSWANISRTWQTSKNKSASKAGLYSVCFHYSRTTLS